MEVSYIKNLPPLSQARGRRISYQESKAALNHGSSIPKSMTKQFPTSSLAKKPVR
jgi:hypothetical protein